MKTRIAVAVGAAAIAFMAPGAAAGASGSDVSEAPQHCVHNLATNETTCDTSLSQARERAADGRRIYELVRLYNYSNFDIDGGTFSISDTSRCTSGYDNEPRKNVPNLREAGVRSHNNWANSVRTYNRCDVRLFDDFQYEGASSTWIHEASNLDEIRGRWNNRASSLRIS